MFQLTATETENLISQIAISSWGGCRKLPFAFTEHGAIQGHFSNKLLELRPVLAATTGYTLARYRVATGSA